MLKLDFYQEEGLGQGSGHLLKPLSLCTLTMLLVFLGGSTSQILQESSLRDGEGIMENVRRKEMGVCWLSWSQVSEILYAGMLGYVLRFCVLPVVVGGRLAACSFPGCSAPK